MTSYEMNSKASVAHNEHLRELPGNKEKVNLNSNASGRIQNPLAHYTPEELASNVDSFVTRYQLEDIRDLIRKGAQVAANPPEFETVEGLDPAEVVALRREVTHKWSQPKALYVTIILCSIGAAVQGWDQTGSNGANLSFPDEFGIGSGTDYDTWIVGLVNAAPYMASAAIGCWLSDPLNNFFGRRGTIFFSAIFCTLSPIGGALTQTWQELFATRVLLGIGMGLKGSTIPIFAAENSPPLIRGALVMTWQLWTAAGIFLGFCANLAVYRVGKIAWRLQIGSAFIPAVPLLLGIYFCPESPRWYIKKGRMRNAYNSLVVLRNTKLQAARDLFYIYSQIEEERAFVGTQTNVLTRWVQLFTIPRIRRASLAAWTVMIAQQMCGINIIAFYSSTIFVEAGASNLSALFASWGFGLVNFIFAWPAIFTIDTFGRRSLLLFTFPQMCWTLLAAGMCFFIGGVYNPNPPPAHLGLVALFIFLFAAFYSPGEGPVPFTYSAEVFPLSHREVGMGFAVATCLGWSSVLSITFPRLLKAFGPPGAFGFYSALNAVAFCMIFWYVSLLHSESSSALTFVVSYQRPSRGRWRSWTTSSPSQRGSSSNISSRKPCLTGSTDGFSEGKLLPWNRSSCLKTLCRQTSRRPSTTPTRPEGPCRMNISKTFVAHSET